MYTLIIYLMFGIATSITDVESIKWTVGGFTTLEECNSYPGSVDETIFVSPTGEQPKGILYMCKKEKDHEPL